MAKEITFDKFIRWTGITLIVLGVDEGDACPSDKFIECYLFSHFSLFL